VVSEANLYVVGCNPARQIRALPESNPNMVVAGYVYAVHPYVTRCALFAAVLRKDLFVEDRPLAFAERVLQLMSDTDCTAKACNGLLGVEAGYE